MSEQFLPFEEKELEDLLNYNKQVKQTRPKDVYGLTPKEKAFCDLLLQNRPACEAYRAAFNCKTDNFNTVYSSAYKWPPLFVNAFCAKLAYELCPNVEQSKADRAMLFQDFAQAVAQAKRVNAMQNPSYALPPTDFELGRYGV